MNLRYILLSVYKREVQQASVFEKNTVPIH